MMFVLRKGIFRPVWSRKFKLGSNLERRKTGLTWKGSRVQSLIASLLSMQTRFFGRIASEGLSSRGLVAGRRLDEIGLRKNNSDTCWKGNAVDAESGLTIGSQ